MYEEQGADNWVQTHILYAPEAADQVAMYDNFGYDIGLDGNTLVVTNMYADDFFTSGGQAYVFTAAGGWDSAPLDLYGSVEGVNYKFGSSCDISGQTIVIGGTGVPGDGICSDQSAGRVFVFRESSLGANDWNEVSNHEPSDCGAYGHYGDWLGEAVRIDGKNFVSGAESVGSSYPNIGQAYVFHESSPGVWAETKILYEPNPSFETRFGACVDISGRNIAIGSSVGYVSMYYEVALDGGDWQLIEQLDTGIEDSYQIELEGSNVLYGLTGIYDTFVAGTVYLFTEVTPGVDWAPMNVVGDAAGLTGSLFGHGLALQGDTVAIGAPWNDHPIDPTTPGTVSIRKLVNCFPDYCPGHLCVNGATCVSGTSDYTCSCVEGWEGTYCENSVDECTSSPCLNDGVCTDAGLDAFSCDCTGTGFEGTTCELDVDECLSNPCVNAGICTDTGTNMYSCNCTGTGFEGSECQSDVDDCTSSPCLNDGFCTDAGANMYSCNCTGTGFKGLVCQGDVDDCTSSPCSNDGLCTDTGTNMYSCNCTGTGFEGSNCQSDVDDCGSSPCLNAGVCTDTGTDMYSCNCTGTEFEGSECQSEIDKCSSSPCFNQGTCTHLLDDYVCNCTNTGYKGISCELDVDDCLSNPCLNGGTCTDTGTHKFTCECPDTGYDGATCSNNINDCVTNACQNEAPCVDGLMNYTCNCTAGTAGYEGEFCDQDIDDCASSPCLNQGTCFDVLLGFLCDCTDLAYEGDVCDSYVPCLSLVCENGGTCEDDVCSCPNDFSGALCEISLVVNEEIEVNIFTLSFADFTHDNDTTESFLLELPTLLSQASPGTDPADFTVKLLPSGEYEVTVVTAQDVDINSIVNDIQADPELQERTGGVDIKLQNEIEDEDVEEKKKPEDMTWLIVLLVLVGMVLIVGGGYGAKRYMQSQDNGIIVPYKGDKMSMPL